ncbi:hypothetical protein Tco_0195617 [Tanacetum coccineum]
MTTLQFADTHNLVAFLSKPAESEGFEQIVDFLNANPIRYALMINPTIYTSCTEQFWATVNREVQLQALVDGKKIIVTEASIRRDLQLNDEEGTDCLLNATIFEELTRMGFVQVFLEKQLEGMQSHKRIYVTPSHTKKIFRNMRRVGKGFSGRDTPLFPTMMVQAQQEQGEGLEMPTDPHHTPTIIQPSTSQPQKKQRSRRTKRKDTEVGRSARVVSSDEASLGDQEDASKQGRKINDIDKDAEITLVHETQERYGDEEMFDTGVLDDEEVLEEPEVTIKDVNLNVDEVTLAQALLALKSAKVQEIANVIEEPNADYQMAQQMQAEEQEKLSIEEKSKLFVQLLEARKKHFAVMRTQEMRNKPSTKAQKRNTMSTYLKNMVGYKHNQLKNKSFDDIQNEVRAEGSETRTEGSSKRAGEDLQQESIKKQKGVLDWKIYDLCGVHSLRKQNVHIHMLVEEKRYPLTPAIIIDMLNKKLQHDRFNEMGRIVGIKRLHDDLEVTAAKVCVTAAK